MAKRKEPKLKDDPKLYTPMAPSWQIPGVASMPEVKTGWLRLAFFGPEAPADEIHSWWREPLRDNEAGRKVLRAIIAAFRAHQGRCDYDDE